MSQKSSLPQPTQSVSRVLTADKRDAFKISVGVKPNGLAFDPARGTLIAANVGDPQLRIRIQYRSWTSRAGRGSPKSKSLVVRVGRFTSAARPQSGRLYVAIGDPGLIVKVSGSGLSSCGDGAPPCVARSANGCTFISNRNKYYVRPRSLRTQGKGGRTDLPARDNFNIPCRNGAIGTRGFVVPRPKYCVQV